ncbi:MAG: DASS family sodium-coupled anion symporter, partial [Burkholderiales bacterium]|nr:DASS family sodium-coupled anion symporter [Burkholderiales bacterium]
MDSKINIGTFSPGVKRFVLVAAPLLAILTYYLLPSEYLNSAGEMVPFSHAGRACLAVVLLMALWWFTEAVPIAVTALVPIVAFPMLKVTTGAAAMAPYASSTIFLFMGGFILAAGVSRWGLDRRIALTTLRIFGTTSGAIVGGLMFATAFISMWVSNTATAAMMIPIALAILNLVREANGGEILETEKNFALCILLAIAYGASIGGMGTIIGSPPNGIYVRYMEQTYGIQVNLLEWMKVGMPVVIIFLPVCWFILTKILYRNTIKEVKGGAEWVKDELGRMGPLNNGEKAVAAVFILAIFLWSFGSFIQDITIFGSQPFKPMSEAVVGMFCGILLFCIPVDIKHGIRALSWKDAENISWDVLLLFGGGLSMADAIQKSGCGELIAAQATMFAHAPAFWVIVGICALVAVVTNFTSNTALAATMMPLLANAAPILGVPTQSLLITTALACSAAFMMPVGTPPNAIIFGTGRITIIQMARTGFVLT